MTVSFNIEYRTSWGEEVRIAGLLPESIPMHTTDGIYWTADVELEVPKEGMTINYSYQIEQNQIIIRKEWDSFPRRLFLSGNSTEKGWSSRHTPHASTKTIAWQFAEIRKHWETGTRTKRFP